MTPTSERAVAWLRLALTTTAHGFDLELPHAPTPYDVDRRLLSWKQAGWILRGEFSPDLSQRVLSIVHPDRAATMKEAKKVLDLGRQMGVDFYPSSYWWRPGPKAAEALALLPKSKELLPGELVRYRRGFLRNIGMDGDDEMLRWRGTVILSRSLHLVECGQKPVPCHCCGHADGVPSYEEDCYRCHGSGKAIRMRVNTVNIERAQ